MVEGNHSSFDLLADATVDVWLTENMRQRGKVAAAGTVNLRLRQGTVVGLVSRNRHGCTLSSAEALGFTHEVLPFHKLLFK